MNQPQIESMISSIDEFYDKKIAVATLYESGKISLVEFNKENKKLDGELDDNLPEYNEHEDHALFELKQFSTNKQQTHV